MADLIKEGKILSWGISETSEQLRFENTHEALINQQTWEIAALQKKFDTMQKRETELTKLLYLLPGHYCGNNLFLRKRC